jgi:hypothetical protein
MASYTSAPVAARIAEHLIGRHHTHLLETPILYVFQDTAAVSKGRIVLAKARKVSGLNAFLAALAAGDTVDDPDHDYTFFVMEIAADRWAGLTDGQRQALVDHELCHFAVGEDEDTGAAILWIRGHDVEEFTGVVERHGLWSPDLETFAGICATAGSST